MVYTQGTSRFLLQGGPNAPLGFAKGVDFQTKGGILNFFKWAMFSAYIKGVFMKIFQKSTFLSDQYLSDQYLSDAFGPIKNIGPSPKLLLVKGQRLCVITLHAQFSIACPENPP